MHACRKDTLIEVESGASAPDPRPVFVLEFIAI